MKATWNGTTIAESNDTTIVDSNHYFPKSSINNDYFVDSDKTTVCGWKGTANYFSVVVDGETNQDAAWYYSEPKEAAKEITGMVAFWRGVQVVD